MLRNGKPALGRLFFVGSAGDSPAPVGDPPTGTREDEGRPGKENLLNRREQSLFFFVAFRSAWRSRKQSFRSAPTRRRFGAAGLVLLRWATSRPAGKR